MTHDPDIERVLDHWLTEGPMQMPSRFLDDTLDRIDRAPEQHRLARLLTRVPTMHATLRFAAVAAVALAAAGLGAVALMQAREVGPPSDGPGLLPASLQAEWHPVGNRQHPMMSGGTGQFDLDIVIDPTTITIFEWHADVRNSASLLGPDRVDLRIDNLVVQWGGTERTVWHCQVGDAGTYTFSLSLGDQLLTLTPVNDACAERATILAGDWTRTELGDLAPGLHVSQGFRPFDGATSGQFSYSVPTGWAEYEAAPNVLAIGIRGASAGASIRLFSNVVPVKNSPDQGCAATPADVHPADVQGTPAAIAAWLATRLAVTTPTPVRIGGLRGVMVDASVIPSAMCPDLFVDFAHPAATGLSDEARARYIILDRGDGQVLLIDIEAPDDATWDEAVANAMPVVETFEFTR